jgi:DNA-binding CsgD family transcriptional regulator
LKKTIDSDEELSIANEVFYRELLKINNTLSPSDLKMCAQLKLNLNTKEISQMNYQSIRTTEGARYRIRKKLGLSSTDNLNTFLMSIKC